MFAAKKTDQASAANIIYVGGTSGSFTVTTASNSTTLSVTGLTGGIASAPSLGDLVVVTAGLGGTSDYPIYTQGKAITRAYTNSSQDNTFAILVKYALMLDDLSVVRFITQSSSTNREYAVTVHVYRNATGYFNPSVDITTAQATNTAIPNPPAITPSQAGSIIHVGASAGNNNGQPTFTASYLSGFISQAGANLTYDEVTGAGYVTWTSGSYDPAAWTFSLSDSTNFSNNSATVAIAPKPSYSGPTWVGGDESVNASGVTTTTLTLNKPSATAENDLMIVYTNVSDTGTTWTAPSGWTEVIDTSGVAAYYKVATASEGSNYTFTASKSGQVSGIIVVFRGAAWDTVGSVGTGTSITIPAITLASNNSVVLAFARESSTNRWQGEITDNTFTYIYKEVNARDTYSFNLAMKQGVAAGSTGTVSAGTFTNSGSLGFLIGIKPA